MESLTVMSRATLIFCLGEKGHVVKNEVEALKTACDNLGGTLTRDFLLQVSRPLLSRSSVSPSAITSDSSRSVMWILIEMEIFCLELSLILVFLTLLTERYRGSV
jgi:hypothetical protein